MDLYTQRLQQRRAEIAALTSRERNLSLARLAAIVATLVIWWFFGWGSLVPLAVFLALIVIHDRAITRRKRAEAAAKFYELGLARVNDEWIGTGVAGDEFSDEHHPYAADLDLFGKGSLFELLCIATTAAGRARLASWLKDPPPVIAEIRERQEAVAELREGVTLREEMAGVAAEVSAEIEQARLGQWASMAALLPSRAERSIALVLGIAGGVLLALSLPSLAAKIVGFTHPQAVSRLGPLADLPLWPLLIVFAIQMLFARRLGERVARTVAGVERAEPALALLAQLLRRVEQERFTSPRLAALRARLDREGQPASRQIEKLRRLVALLDARRNQFFAPIAMALLWTTNLAFAIEKWRRASGSEIVGWIEAVGELEALSSLASFAYEHPAFATPQVVDEPPLFAATQLGHPLIPAARRICNDIRLDGELRLLVVSGSNMSGKSTMMRSVGVGAVLAMAGAPVCATSMKIAPTIIGASIRINDSLHEGSSRFYAEILRLRQILELASAGRPLLFLLDEVLHGTNSHDRRIGAEAVVRGLVARGAVGLVSTHDLALAQIVETLAPRAANVHFEDHLEEGRMVFDYQMRPGVVTKSNAIELMRAVGIEV